MDTAIKNFLQRRVASNQRPELIYRAVLRAFPDSDLSQITRCAQEVRRRYLLSNVCRINQANHPHGIAKKGSKHVVSNLSAWKTIPQRIGKDL